MITVYMLAYRAFKYFEASINSMLATASEPLDITVIDNQSAASAKIVSYCKELVDAGKVTRVVSMSNNCMIRAFNWAFENYPPDGSEKFFMMTELDLLVPPDCDWVRETRKMQEQHVLSAFPLSSTNYVPPNKGHIDTPPWCGLWLCGLNTEIFCKGYNEWLSFGEPISDIWVRGYMSTQGKVTRSKRRLYHMAWDLYKESDPDLKKYWKEKLAGLKWEQAPMCKVAEVYERTL